MKYKYSPPLLVKKLFNDFLWNSTLDKLLLTFDDGPNPTTTEKILNELNRLAIKSVFFCVGENLEKYPSLAKEIISEGHMIGNHTYSHAKINQQNKNEVKESIIKVQDLVLKNLNYQIRYFRPPHGRFSIDTNTLLKDVNLINVMWSLLTYDYKNDLNIVKFALTKYLTSNSIIVLHDSNKSEAIIVDAIKFIVEEAERKNYEIGKPFECLK